MTDRELLELAAKAAGIKTSLHKETDSLWIDGPRVWNPLTDDGDALLLAAKLGFIIDLGPVSCSVHERDGRKDVGFEWRNEDPYAATRRAIVSAAAELGEGMK